MNSKAAFRALLWLFAAVLLVYGAIPIANALLGESIKDNRTWFEAGQHVLHGEPLYPQSNEPFPFMYPPTAALLLAPISLLGSTGLVVALVLVNAVAWCASIILALRLATGNWRRAPLVVYLIPNVIISVYAWSNFHLAQPSLLLLALILGGFVLLQEKRSLLAGGLFAIAAAIKAFPVIVVLYLIYRRQWLAAVSLAITLTFLLIVLPAPFRGIAQARADLVRWTQGMLLKYDEGGVAQRPERSYSWKNQSIFGFANRMLRRVDTDEAMSKRPPVYANVADLSFPLVNRIIAGAALLLGLIYIAVMPRREQRNRETDALEIALFVLLMLLFTPLAFGYLFACLLFPFAVLAERVGQHASGRLLAGGIAAVALLALTIPFQKTAQTYGNTFFATLILFGALALELWEVKRGAAE
ncbi:MAG: glycosyltransferase family 87 protein [Chthoniobacterales bacterium]